MEETKKYTIFAGVNGAGKSTLYKLFDGKDIGIRINSDEIITQSGWDWRDAKAQFKAMRIAVEKIRSCIEEGKSFNQETTLAGHSIIKTIKEAKEKGFSVQMCYVGLESPELAIKRVSNRVKEGGHGIDEGDIRRRYDTSLSTLKEVIPFCDYIEFFDNSKKFETIALYDKGKIIEKKETNWLNQVIKDIPKLDQVKKEKRKPTLKEVLERGKKRQSELTSKEHNKSRTLK
ncbi:zeta toxin family protein [Oribacterium sinus]|mgnify:FL=1|jgi:ATPase|uniref:zeta toxin family protein n=1 Tax=Oribacterium sinus TaxID=237576 RepID=UPI0028E9F432|nr:zeta toxin family protein [Oribacterium sinus]